jgi:AsmA family protein
MAKPLRIALIVVLGIVLLLVVLGLVANSQWARAQVEEQLSEQFDGRAVDIADHSLGWGFPLRVQAEGVRIANAPWAATENLLELDRLDVRVRVLPLLRGAVDLVSLELERPVVNLERQADGTANWDALIDEDDDTESDFRLGSLDISDGHLSYRDALLDADLTLDFHTTSSRDGEHALHADGQGRMLGEDFALTLRGAPPADALEDDAPYEIRLASSLGGATASFDGHALDLINFGELHGLFSLEMPAMPELFERLGQPGLTMPALQLGGRIAHSGERWALEDLALQAENTEITGRLSLEQRDLSLFEIELRGPELNLDDWNLAGWLDERVDLLEEVVEEVAEEPVALDRRYAEIVEPLQDYRGRFTLELDRLVFAGHPFQDVALVGELDDESLRVDRLAMMDGEGGFNVSGALGLDAREPAFGIAMQFDRLELGNLLAFADLEELGVLDGQLSTRLVDSDLLLEDTRLAYQDQALALQLEMRAEPRSLDDGRQGIQLSGEGSRNDQSFEYAFALGPLLDLDGDDPYPLSGALASGETRLAIDGTLVQPLDLREVDLQVVVEGPNPAQLNALLGLELPITIGYRLQTRLRIADQTIELSGFDLRAGESDLQGDLRYELAARPRLTIDARSSRLDLDDLFLAVEDNTELDEQVEEITQRERVFSDELLELDLLREMDARITYRADRLISSQIPLDDLHLDAELEQGVLRLQPLEAGLGEGTLVSNLLLDASETRLQGRLELNMTGVGLAPLLRNVEQDDAADLASGVMGGSSELSFSGQSIRELMASLDGMLELIISGGHLDSLIVEVLGLHVGEAVVTALTDSEDVGLRCAYARLEADSGLVGLEQFLISTEETNFTAEGMVDLNTEQLEVSLESHADSISIFSVDSPIELHGQLSDINVRVLTGGVIARGAASVVGALIAPPLAVLPWIEGLGQDRSPGCREVIDSLDASMEPKTQPAGA